MCIQDSDLQSSPTCPSELVITLKKADIRHLCACYSWRCCGSSSAIFRCGH